MDLIVVLAEIDGTSIPLSYLLIAVDARSQLSRLTNAGAMSYTLEKFLQPIKSTSFSPIFFHYDKDNPEIYKIRNI